MFEKTLPYVVAGCVFPVSHDVHYGALETHIIDLRRFSQNTNNRVQVTSNILKPDMSNCLASRNIETICIVYGIKRTEH